MYIHAECNTVVNMAGDTPLSLACANCDLDTVKYLVNCYMHCDPKSMFTFSKNVHIECTYMHVVNIKMVTNRITINRNSKYY